MDTGAALATATGAAGRKSSNGDTFAGLSEDPEGIVREASRAKTDTCICEQEEQDKLMSLMDTGAALATATGAAGRKSTDGDAVAGLSEGPESIVREASRAKASEEAFILSIASCTVHEERQDPTALTATLEQQR